MDAVPPQSYSGIPSRDILPSGDSRAMSRYGFSSSVSRLIRSSTRASSASEALQNGYLSCGGSQARGIGTTGPGGTHGGAGGGSLWMEPETMPGSPPWDVSTLSLRMHCAPPFCLGSNVKALQVFCPATPTFELAVHQSQHAAALAACADGCCAVFHSPLPMTSPALPGMHAPPSPVAATAPPSSAVSSSIAASVPPEVAAQREPELRGQFDSAERTATATGRRRGESQSPWIAFFCRSPSEPARGCRLDNQIGISIFPSLQLTQLQTRNYKRTD